MRWWATAAELVALWSVSPLELGALWAALAALGAPAAVAAQVAGPAAGLAVGRAAGAARAGTVAAGLALVAQWAQLLRAEAESVEKARA